MNNSNVEIYTTTYCPYCVKAKQLLEQKNVAYQEINVEGDEAARSALMDKAGGKKTVPQIFIKGQHIGGCDDLYTLDSKGELDKLLSEL